MRLVAFTALLLLTCVAGELDQGSTTDIRVEATNSSVHSEGASVISSASPPLQSLPPLPSTPSPTPSSPRLTRAFDSQSQQPQLTPPWSGAPPRPWAGVRPGAPEQNYEVDESLSLVTNGRAHGVQPSPAPGVLMKKQEQEGQKQVGYVVEGRRYRKYRVEERTPDGYIVGEYGVVSHDDGQLRAVRYTADGATNPKLIYDTLVKFLSL